MELIEKIIRKKKPEVVFIEPFFGCNLKCFFCLHGRGYHLKSEKLPPDIFEKIKPAISEAQMVHFAGWGEPFLNNHLYDYLTFLKSTAKPYFIISNGNAIQDKYIPLLVASESRLAISLDAGNEAAYGATRNGNWQAIITTLQKINAAKQSANSPFPILELKLHLNDHNIGSITDLPKLCSMLGVAMVTLKWTTLPEQFKEQSPFTRKEQYRVLIEKTVDTLQKLGVQVMNNAKFGTTQMLCWDTKPYTFIGANGTVAACCFKWVTIGDLHLNSFYDIYNSARHREVYYNLLNNTPLPRCSTCIYVRDLDFQNNSNDFIKEQDEELEIIAARSAAQAKHAELAALEQEFQRGVRSFKNGHFRKAAETFLKVSVGYPDFFEIRHNLAFSYAMLGAYDRSIEVYRKIEGIPHLKEIFDPTLRELCAGPLGIPGYQPASLAR